MLTSPGFLWMLMVPCVCVFATVTWRHAPAVAAASVLSHRLAVLHSDQRCVAPGKHILDILECDVEIIY